MAATWGDGPPSEERAAEILDALTLASPCSTCGAAVGQPCRPGCTYRPEPRWYGDNANEEPRP